MSTILYEVRAVPVVGSYPINGRYIATVPAKFGALRDWPDSNAIYEALPHYWKKAYQYQPVSFWADRDNDEITLHGSLYSKRGKKLATFYATRKNV